VVGDLGRARIAVTDVNKSPTFKAVQDVVSPNRDARPRSGDFRT